MRRKLALGLGSIGLIVFLLGAAAMIKLGPRFVFGMLRYDTRREGELQVGDRAPDIKMLALDGSTEVRLSEHLGKRPVVIVFGSFT
jgi:hypothetical protein